MKTILTLLLDEVFGTVRRTVERPKRRREIQRLTKENQHLRRKLERIQTHLKGGENDVATT